MNKIDLIVEDISLEYSQEKIIAYMQAVCKQIGADNKEFSLLICNDEYIKKLNKTYRSKDEPTDILSFCTEDEEPWDFVTDPEEADETIYWGDLVLSVDSLKTNAEYFKVEQQEEFKRLLIHGILHLSGMDHKTNDTNEEMLIYQEKILQEFGEFKF